MINVYHVPLTMSDAGEKIEKGQLYWYARHIGGEASPMHFTSKGGKDGFRTGFIGPRSLQRPDKWHPCPKQGQGETLGRDEKPERVSPSKGNGCYSVAPELSSLLVFQEKPEIRIFMWNFSIFKHSAGQTKHSHWFWPLLYNRECLLLFRQTNECSITRRNLEVSVRLCSSKGCRPHPKPLRY